MHDFDVADDLILLDSRIFTEIGDLGALSFDAFHSSRTGVADDADVRIIYNSRSGTLSYDADGSGAGEAIEFARLGANLSLAADDFYII